MNRLKELRTQKGYTQIQLAKLLNTTQSNVSGWESEKWQPDQEALIQMAKLFNVTIDYLVGISSFPYGEKATYNIELAPEAEDERRMLDLYRAVKEKGGNESAIKFIDLLSDLLLKKGE